VILIFAIGVLSLWPFILMATVPLAFLHPLGRLIAFVLGLAFFLAVWFIPWDSGLHGEGIWFSFLGLGLCTAAVLAEVAFRVIRRLRQRQAKRF
jgi:hypothetical protein